MPTMIESRNHLVKSDFGMASYFRFFKKKNKESDIKTSKVYGEIIKEFYSHVRDGISKKGNPIIFPSKIGHVELRKVKSEIKINDDGTVINQLPTNWKETRKLWRENPVAKEKGIKIKFTNEHTDGYTFKVTYLKSKATFKNKSVYKIRFNRDLKRNLSRSIFDGNIDAFVKNY